MLPVLEALGLPATIYVTTYFAQKQLPVFDLAVRYLVDSAAPQTLDLAALGIEDGPSFALGDAVVRDQASDCIRAYGRASLDAPELIGLSGAVISLPIDASGPGVCPFESAALTSSPNA